MMLGLSILFIMERFTPYGFGYFGFFFGNLAVTSALVIYYTASYSIAKNLVQGVREASPASLVGVNTVIYIVLSISGSIAAFVIDKVSSSEDSSGFFIPWKTLLIYFLVGLLLSIVSAVALLAVKLCGDGKHEHFQYHIHHYGTHPTLQRSLQSVVN